VLAHAEIESYLEDRVVEIAKQAWAAWQKDERVSRVSISLLGFSGKEMHLPPDSLAAPANKQNKNWIDLLELTDRLGNCVSEFVYRVSKENHGVKLKFNTSNRELIDLMG
jgi:hypothetical protein